MSGDSLERVLEGVLFLFSETGTEGGHWAFQDRNFISKIYPSFGIFPHQTVWDVYRPKRKGESLDDVEVFLEDKWLPLSDPIMEDPDYIISSLFCGENSGDHEADARLMAKYGFKIKYDVDRMNEEYGEGNWKLENSHTAVAPDGTRIFVGGTPHTEPNRPYGVPQNGLTRSTIKWEDGAIQRKRLSTSLLVTNWDYDGLHVLENGDRLTIYHPDSKEEVWNGEIKLKRHKAFTEHASGMWIHADQVGIERDIWAEYFFGEYNAKLITKRRKG